MANLIYNKGLYLLLNNDLDSLDLRVLATRDGLITQTAIMNTLTEALAGVNTEISGGTYARQALANKSITEDDTNNFAYLDADDINFGVPPAGQTATGVILYQHVGADTVNLVIAFFDTANVATDGVQALRVTWDTPANGGILKVSD